MAKMTVINTGPISNAAAPVYYPDTYLVGAGTGPLVLFDLAYAGSYAGATGGTAPAEGAVVRDLTGRGNHGIVTVIGGAPTGGNIKLPSYGGGGFNFSALTQVGGEIAFPSAIAEHIAAQTNSYYLIMLYVILPADADWPTTTQTQPIYAFANASNGWQGQSELAMPYIGASGGLKRLLAQVASAATYQTLGSTNAAAGDFGTLNQIAIYRTASGVFLRAKNSTRTWSATNGANLKPTLALTGRQWHVGVGSAFWPTTFGTAAKFGVRRGAIEDLELSGRDPVAVLDADWTRTVARGVFS